MVGAAGLGVVVEHLHVRRGGQDVLLDVTVTIPGGQVVGLLGPSGSGKSTLIRAIVGVQVVVGGTVTVLGEGAGSPSLRRRVAYVTQSPSVYDDLSVHDNVAYFAGILGAGPGSVERAIALVDLREQAGTRVGALSGGQRSRVSLAAALVGDPEVLVLDEPTVGLDPVLRRDLWNLFHRLADGGACLFVSSHVMDEATRFDRLILLRSGRVLADTTPALLLETTGCQDAESAFLKLVDEAGGAAGGGRQP